MAPSETNVLGAITIGVLIDIFLQGIATTQLYTYYSRFPKDLRLLKAVVAIVWIAGMGHTVSMTYTIYDVAISQRTVPFGLIILPQSLPAAVAFGAIIHPLVQIVYAYRIYKFSQSYAIPVICWSLSAYQLVATLVFMGTCPPIRDQATFELLAEYEREWNWLIYSMFASTATVEIVLAGSVCYWLHQSRVLGMKDTTKILDRLMQWTIQTGLITSLTAIATIICFSVASTNFVWIALFTVVAGLYPTTLLAMLNGRTLLSRMQSTGSNAFMLAEDGAGRVRESVGCLDKPTVNGRVLDIRFCDQDANVKTPPMDKFRSVY